MFNIQDISLTFTINYFLLFITLLIIVVYTFYIYKFTIPEVALSFKSILILLRTFALFFLFIIIFEPVLTYSQKIIIEPVQYWFFDNSKSITIEDKTNREETFKKITNELQQSQLMQNAKLFTFGSEVRELEQTGFDYIYFDEPVTNFAKIFNLKDIKEKNIASFVIISDGVITDGVNPIFTAERLNIPVHSVGIGDTASRNDLEIRRVLYNEFVYAETPTAINVSINNKGFSGKNVELTLFEDDTMISQETISLKDDGIYNADFTYIPVFEGEKKLTLSLTQLEGEHTYANNRHVFFVNVLDTKINIVVISGSPSSDLSFLLQSLRTDDNLEVKTITQVAVKKYLENVNIDSRIDSADVFFLVGFPSKETEDELTNKVLSNIREKNIPYFIMLSPGTDINKLRVMQGELPFTINRQLEGFSQVQPNITGEFLRHPLLQNNAANIVDAWNNLPPIVKSNYELVPKPESEIISRLKINNVPLNTALIVSRRLGKKNSIALLAADSWRWKLQTAQRNLDLYDRFIHNSVKWLNIKDDQKQFDVNTSKRIYALGESVEFAAQVYDDAFNPLSDAGVTIKIKSPDDETEVNLNALGSGLYEGSFQTQTTGDFSFSAEASLNGKKIGNDEGKFSIGDVDIELLNPSMDKEFLMTLSNNTAGNFFHYSDYNKLFDKLNEEINISSKDQVSKSEINLWSNEWLLIIVIFLFSLEWFLRKRAGML